jgi:hypothetical protein
MFNKMVVFSKTLSKKFRAVFGGRGWGATSPNAKSDAVWGRFGDAAGDALNPMIFLFLYFSIL